MRERHLGEELVGRFSAVAGTTVAAYAGLVILVSAVMGEVQVRRSLERTADVVESLLGLYADPEGSPTTVAPEMLADQLVGMGQQFAITRAPGGGDGAVYFLSPTMPAKRLAGLAAAATPAEVRAVVLEAIAERARWQSRVLHRESGDFDIYMIGSRMPTVWVLVALSAAAVLILPAAIYFARRGARQTVQNALQPLEQVASETRTIGPADLDRRLTVPTGQVEVTELAEAINRMLERVDRSHRALESFTGDASHELRTPLSHLRGQAQWALAPGRTPEELREALTAIQREVERTNKMVDDLLLIARGGSQQIALERRPFDLRTVVKEVEEITQAMAIDRGLTVRSEVENGAVVLGDPDRTRHVLLNLASNAVRYTTHGSVTITVRHRDGEVGVEVRDTGPGISAEHLEHIFDRFYRVDQSRNRALGGAGLGLTIARLLAELQDGRITVSSEVDRGSSFTVWLPTAAV